MPDYFPAIHPFNRGRLRVSDLHEIYFEECGNPKGKPVVILHGGPGSGINAFMRRLHDPARYRIILFDQRGCGASTPFVELRENTTWDLVSDMERLRDHLGISRWQVFGGSWGATLALAYAETYPQYVAELILRGVFAGRRSEADWTYKAGASHLFPEEWDRFINFIPPEEREDLLLAYHRRLTGADEVLRLAAARAWSRWEAVISTLRPDPLRLSAAGRDHFALSVSAIEVHYLVNDCFFEKDGQILSEAKRIADIPGAIIQGRYDTVTPASTAWQLHKAWPRSQFTIVDDAGHAGSEPGIVSALIETTQHFACAGRMPDSIV